MRSPFNPHNEHRAYFMAHNVLYDMAQDYFAEIEKPIIRLKGIYRDPTSAEKAEHSGRSPWFDNPQYYFPKWFGCTRYQVRTMVSSQLQANDRWHVSSIQVGRNRRGNRTHTKLCGTMRNMGRLL